MNEEWLELLVAYLQDWWKCIISPTYSYLHLTMILGDEAIEMIRKHVREIAMEEDLKEVLGKCSSRGKSGHWFPQSLLTPHLSSLFAAVIRSLACSSHLQCKARKPAVRRRKPTGLHLPRPVSKLVTEIKIPMPLYHPMFNGAASSQLTSSIEVSQPPLAEIQPNSLLHNSIPPSCPPKSRWARDEEIDEIESMASPASHFTITFPMKCIHEHDLEWFEDWESWKSRH